MITSVTNLDNTILIVATPGTLQAELDSIAYYSHGEATIDGHTIDVRYEGEPFPAWLVELTLRERFDFAYPAAVARPTVPTYLDGSLLITGATGSGKSALLRALATNYITEGAAVVLIDLHDRTWSEFVSGPEVSTAANIAEAALFLGHLSDAVRTGTAQPAVVLIDELYSLTAAAQYTDGLSETDRNWMAGRARQLQDDLRVLLHCGRAQGVFVVATSHRVDAVTTPPLTWAAAGRLLLRGRRPVTATALATNFGPRAESAAAMFESGKRFEYRGVVMHDSQLFGFDPEWVAAVVAGG